MIHPETLRQGEWSRDQIAQHYERDLLWCALNDNSTDLSAVWPIVDASDFSDLHACQLFEWLRRMWAKLGVIDVVALLEAMQFRNPQLFAYANDLWGRVCQEGDPMPWRVGAYAREIHERAQQRRLAAIAEAEREVLSGRSARLPDGTYIEAGTPANEAIGITDAARRRLAKVTKGAALSAPLSSFRERALATPETAGLPFGLHALDRLLRGGARPGTLIVVGARPGMGKTAMLLNAVTAWAVEGHAGVVFSLEMGAHELYGRLLCSASGLTEDEWGTDWDTVLDAADKVDRLAVHVADAPQMTLESIRAECDRRHAEGTLKWIVVDYLTLMGTDPSLRDHHLRVAANSSGLKAIAKDFGIPVVLAAQLNRELEKRGNKRPIPSDLRDAGQIEQDADVILFLYREVVHDESYPNPEEAEFIIAKHRGGQTGTVTMRWNGPLTRFENVTSDTDWRI